MGTIVISENVTLDGVIEDPAGERGLRARRLVGRVGDRGRDEAAKSWSRTRFTRRPCCLVGTATSFSPRRWPSRSGELADRLNGCPSTSYPRPSRSLAGITRRC